MIAALTFGDQVYRLRQLDRIPLSASASTCSACVDGTSARAGFSFGQRADSRTVAWFNVSCWLPFQLAAWTACVNLAANALAPRDSLNGPRFMRTRWLGTIVNTLAIGFPIGLLGTLLPLLARSQQAIGVASDAYVQLDRELKTAAAQPGPFALKDVLPMLPEAVALQAATGVYVNAVRLVDAVWVFWMSAHAIVSPSPRPPSSRVSSWCPASGCRSGARGRRSISSRGIA